MPQEIQSTFVLPDNPAILVLTGAGISAESGLNTFRASDGLWEGHRVEEVATPEGFEANPNLVHAFYNARRAQLRDVASNAAHHALIELANGCEGELLIVTQNVDDLHDRAMDGLEQGAQCQLIHMHGELRKARCGYCGYIAACEDDIAQHTACESCGHSGAMRSHIVWFGEVPFEMERIYQALRECDLFLSIGTSGNVYPAAQFVMEAQHHGAHTVELNLEPSQGASYFHETYYGSASTLVPHYIKHLLKGVE